MAARLSNTLKTVGAEYQLAPELLATQRELRLLAREDADTTTGLPCLRGWRRAVVGERLLASRAEIFS
jgi:ribonuclease D